MRKFVCILIAAILALSGTLPVFSEEEATGEGMQKLQEVEYVEGEALVKVRTSVEKSRTRLFAGGSFEVETLMDVSAFDTSNSADGEVGENEKRNAERHHEAEAQSEALLLQNAQILTEEKILLVKSDTMSTEELIATLEQRPEVEYAEPNYIFQLASLPGDPHLSKQWYVHDGVDKGASKAVTVWEKSSIGDTAAGKEPVVAIVDSGIDYTHDDLKDVLWKSGKACGMDLTDPEDMDGDGPMDDNGHGTHVAGIIGAQHNTIGISGVSADVRLMALKISDSAGYYHVSAAVAAYSYMLEQQADGVNIIAANNSWGGYAYSRIMEEVFDVAGDNGIISIAASGNASIDHDTNLNYPEGGNRTMYLLVNASNKKGAAVWFSDYGLVDTDLYAPGEGMFSTTIENGEIPSDDDTPGYGYMDGTSAAAPVVTGAIALLYDYYDIEKKVNAVPEGQRAALQREALAEIRARIAGGVTRTEEMKSLCASGGYLDLEKAISSPYPVLDSLEQDGSTAVITGYFFGDAGTLEMDGKRLETNSWSQGEWGKSKITFTLPDGASEGLHEFKITNAADPDAGDGSAQYGRDKLWVEETAEAENGAFFETLMPPDHNALGIVYPQIESAYELAAYDGKIYLAQDGMYRDGGECLVILVYDEKSEEWSVMDVPSQNFDGEVQLTTGDDGLYFVENGLFMDQDTVKSRMQIFRKTGDGDFEAVGEPWEDDVTIYRSTVCDGRYIWMFGGADLREDGSLFPLAEILRFDTKTGEWKTSNISLKTSRYNAVAEIIDGKLIVTGGINRSGQLERTMEIIDLKTGEVTAGADLPEMDPSQEISMASGAYDGKLIITGMFDSKEHTADTYEYDLKTNTWQPLKQHLMDTKVFLLDGTVSGEYFYVYGITLDGGNKKNVFRRLQIRELSEAGELEPPDQEDPENAVGDAEEGDDGTDAQGGSSDKIEPNKVDEKDSADSRPTGLLNTGDPADILLWITLMTAALTAAVGAVSRDSRRQKR